MTAVNSDAGSRGKPEAGTDPWDWAEPTWRSHAGKVSAGRALRRAWPQGSKVAVGISFDSDHETIPLRVGETSPGKISVGQYGARAGAPRIMALLEELSVPASFYMPAVSALLHPEEAKGYVAAGHELGLHGWIHESNMLLDYATERELIERAAGALEKLTGKAPVGIRTPAWDFSDSTLQVIRDLGLLYDSSLMADDVPYEILADGEPTGIVEIPVEWIRDDAPYFSMDRRSGARPYAAPRAVLQIWKDEFDGAYASGGIFQLTMHPHISGHWSRIVVLRELLEYIQGHDGVWFATHEDIARHLIAE